MRLNKYISESGMCSRREADKLIENGSVLINGKRAEIGQVVGQNDAVRVNGQLIKSQLVENTIYLLLNKPRGVISTTEKGIDNNIIDYIAHPLRIFPIGRLDKESQGLILLTNNGDIVNKVLRAGNAHEKVYDVHVHKPLTAQAIDVMKNGVPMLGVVTKKCKIEQLSPTSFQITLVQGLNRQIRRMCQHVGYEVLKLERVRLMHLTCNSLPTGEWRELIQEEISELELLVKDSKSEDTKHASKTPNHAKKNSKSIATKTGSEGTKRYENLKNSKAKEGRREQNSKSGFGTKNKGSFQSATSSRNAKKRR